MADSIVIANGQGFWGDSADAPAQLVAQVPDLEYLTLDYLAEVSMSILAVQRDRDANAGYARDFVEVIESLVPYWRDGSKVRVISNAGGLNPMACARVCAEVLRKAGCPKRIGVVTGDDVLPLLLSESGSYDNLETGEPVANIRDRLVTANAYLGAEAIVAALAQDAEIVITGRVADPSMAVAPAMHRFGWRADDYDRIAGATVAGHLIECGTQVTGGISTDWLNVPDPAHIGFPVVRVEASGECVVTKPAGTGGCVNVRTVKEQLLYEIGDPDRYLSPDSTVSFLSLDVKKDGENRVRVSGARGSAAPPTYKVSATYRDGYRADGMLTIYGKDTAKKAQRCGEIVLQRLADTGCRPERTLVECLGTGAAVGGMANDGMADRLRECVLRISVADSRLEPVQRFTRELMPLVTAGPQGTTGYAGGRPKVRPVFGYWPCLIDRDRVMPEVQVIDI